MIAKITALKRIWFYSLLLVLLILALLSYSLVSAAPLLAVPNAPSGLTATFVSLSEVRLSWTDNSTDESGFRIYRNGALIQTVGINVTGFTSTSTLSCGTIYTYEVEAYNVDGASARAATTLTTPVCPPSAPTNLISTFAGFDEIDLQWQDNSTNEDGFSIERSPTGTGNWTAIATVTANITTYADIGLACNTYYYYRVRAYNIGGNSAYSNVLTSATSSCVPDATPFLQGNTVPEPPEVQLQWVDVANETQYLIERAYTISGPWVEIGTTAADVTFYSDTNVFCGTTYFYRVKSSNTYGASEPSNIYTASWIACLPTAPSDLTATAISSSAIKLNWKDKSNNESGFRIERSPDGLTWAEVTSVGANTVTYTNGGLTCNTAYYFRVGAYNSALPGFYAYSNTAGAVTLPCPPAAPSDLTAFQSGFNEITLVWTDNSADEVWFKIERSPNGTSNWSLIATVGANVTAYVDTDLVCGSSYFYRVRASNANGDSANSNTSGEVVYQCVPPWDPSGLTATPVSQTQINLSWTDNSDNESGFKIERSPNGTGGWVHIATVGMNITSYSSAGLTCNTVYYYRVRSFNPYGNSGYSNIASALTAPCGPTPPPTPANFTVVTLSTSQIKLSWSDVSGETGYKISRSTDNINFTQLVTLGENVKTYTDSNLNCGTKYYYFVQSFNVGGLSAPTKTKYATTSPCGNMAVVKASKVSANPGVEVTVSVTASNIPAAGLGAAKIMLRYDSGLVSVTGCTPDPNGVFTSEACSYNNTAGEVIFDVVSSSGVKPSATLAKIKYKVLSGSPGTVAILDVIVVEFKSPTAVVLPVTDMDGQILVGKRGDVNGDNRVSAVDGLFILKYDVGLYDGVDDFPPPAGTIFLPACDVNLDGKCNVTDAMFVLQCNVGIHNTFCPATSAQAEGLSAQSNVNSAATTPVNLRIGSGIVQPGQNLVLPIRVNVPSSVTFGAATIEVAYNPDVVSVTDCAVNPDEEFDLAQCNATLPGIVRFSLSSLSGVTSEHVLANITFTAVGQPGEYSTLKIRPLMVNTEEGNDLLVKTFDGKISLSVPLNQRPRVYSFRKAGQQDMELPFVAAEFAKAFRGVNGSTLVKVKILSLPSQGVLKLNGVEVLADQKIDMVDLNKLVYVPGTNWSGTDSFRWTGSDGKAFAPKEASVRIKIHLNNLEPKVYTISLTGKVDMPLPLSAAAFMGRFKDPNGDTLIKVMITSLPSHGVLKLDGVAVSTGQEIMLTDLDRLVYEPEAGFIGSDLMSWNGCDGMVYAAKDGAVKFMILP